MSRLVEYKDIMAFHPGYYVADIIEDMDISQTEFAKRLNTTPKNISKLINGQIKLSDEIAKKLSMMLGTSADIWLNFQKEFDMKVLEIKRQKEIDAQAEIVKMIDYSYFVKIAGLPKADKSYDKVINLCSFFKVSDLHILREPDFLVNYRMGITEVQDKNTINAKAWLQTAINFANTNTLGTFNISKLKKSLPQIREMTLQKPEEFMPKIKEIFSKCGIMFVLLPHLKNSGINGAVKWFSSEKVMIAINDRRCYADTFWFSLFHEIKHVMQQKHKITFISSNDEKLENELEQEADQFARDYLIPPEEYAKIRHNNYVKDTEICRFAKNIEVHPGIVAGRLQHDGVISQKRCAQLKVRYQIIVL